MINITISYSVSGNPETAAEQAKIFWQSLPEEIKGSVAIVTPNANVSRPMQGDQYKREFSAKYGGTRLTQVLIDRLCLEGSSEEMYRQLATGLDSGKYKRTSLGIYPNDEGEKEEDFPPEESDRDVFS